jgi:SAM-dependent methyltransferase
MERRKVVWSAAKAGLKAVLPGSVSARLARLKKRIFMDGSYRNLSTSEVFDKVYMDGAWGKDGSGNSTSGSGSHNESVIEPYFEVVSEFLAQLEGPVVVDLGCGDFNVGKRLLPFASRYVACDVSSVILERNRQKYQAPNLEFRQLDLAADALPPGDVAFVRQVFQHLDNASISNFVRKLDSSNIYRYLVVTEHMPRSDFTPNRDKPRGPEIRLYVNSGVNLSAEPFNLRFKKQERVLSLAHDVYGIQGNIVTTLYEF